MRQRTSVPGLRQGLDPVEQVPCSAVAMNSFRTMCHIACIHVLLALAHSRMPWLLLFGHSLPIT